jgi:hypothetical protein
MNNDQPINPAVTPDHDVGLPPPPRLLMMAVIGAVVLLLAGAVTAIFFLRNGFSAASALEYGSKAAPLASVILLAFAVVFRQSLPRRLWLWLTILLVLVWVVGGAAFVVIYQNSLAPGQRETAKTYMPFMKLFDPALPKANDVLPTPIPNQDSVSAQDLLTAPLSLELGGTAEATDTIEVPGLPLVAVTEPVIQLEPSATPTATATATVPPTATLPPVTPTPQPAAVNPPVSQASSGQNLSVALPASARLFGITPVKQGWNNCGPANVTMALSFFGWRQDQEVAASFLKPDREDKNVNPWELVSFVNEQSQVRALTRVGGTMDMLKAFLVNKFPVIIETGYAPADYDWIGHYQTVIGYDDALGKMYIYDSYLGTGENGTGMPEAYDYFDKNWSAFNRTFIVLYTPDKESQVRSILGDWADPQKAAEHAAEVAQSEARANPQNVFAWFNLGSSLVKLGDYKKAASAYDQARRLGTLPWRMTLYQFGPFEAYFNLGRYDEVLALVNANMNNGGEYVEEMYYWQGLVLEKQGDKQKAADAFRRALNHNPHYAAAQDALKKVTA